MIKKTITAIATPSGRGGIGIIRVSGDESLEIAKQIFRPVKKIKSFKSHKLYFGNIIDKKNNILDEVFFAYMQKPNSYTAEDVVEIQSHSSPVVLSKILELLTNNGAELAQPGEFTKRAYLNGRIDLTQAEAVIDIINAKTKISLDIAVSQIQGNLRNIITKIIDDLINLKMNIEAVIDFPEDVGENFDEKKFIKKIKNDIIKKLNKLENNFNNSNVYRDGVKIVIAGPPNSGKSSLLNKLLNKDKSIVTSIPGTTRDIIDELINIDGIPIEISDTAGLHDTEDFVEKIGIERTYDRIKKSDILLLMYENDCEDTIIEIKKFIENYRDKRIIVIENKIDLNSKLKSSIIPDIKISVLNEIGIDKLKNLIVKKIIEDAPENKDSIVPNTRHYNLIKNANINCNRLLDGLLDHTDIELLAIDLNEALENLNKIIGVDTKLDIMDEIFNSFCIGK